MALLVTDVFPPAVGGSGELLANIYSRFDEIPVTVLTTGERRLAEQSETMTIVREGEPADAWGVLDPRGLRRHLRRLRKVRQLTKRTDAVLHCGRALPEGLTACVRRIFDGHRYFCWVHGEEIAYARTSRELKWLFVQVLKRAETIFANSHNTANELRVLGLTGARIVVVHPGVDALRFRPDVPSARHLRRQLTPDDAVLLLTVGRLQRRKGHDLVLEALNRLRDHPASWRYVIIGDGPEKKRLQQIAAARRLTERVVFLGAVPADELSAYYAAADIFVHPNRVEGADFEGFGMVFLEAAAAGLPVIAGRSGGAPEAVDENVTGVLVSGTDSAELTAAIARLIDDPDERRRMGQVGRARVLVEFSWPRAAALVKTVHERVAEAMLNGR